MLTYCYTWIQLQVKSDLKAIGCRLTRRVKRQDQCLKINGPKGLSWTTCWAKWVESGAVATNAKRVRKSSRDVEPLKDVYPAIVYFIVFRDTDSCSESKIYSLLRQRPPYNNYHRGNANNVMETASWQLFTVAKYHNSQLIIDMINMSNKYCLSNCERMTSVEDSKDSVRASNSHPCYPTCPCHVFMINCVEFDTPLQEATMKLNQAWLHK